LYRLMIVEDDTGIAEGIADGAKAWGFEVFCVQNFRDVIKDFDAFTPQLVLLDISLPFYNGYHWCSQIRQRSKVPIIFISSVSDSMNIVMAMNMGADDFIAKPFDMNVLIAKINALLRRSYDFSPEEAPLQHMGAVLDKGENCLVFRSKNIPLSKNEYRILLCLMENKGNVVSRERLMEKLWDTDIFVDENTLTVNINRLRKKLDSAGLEGFITTKFGVGYLIRREG